MCGWLNVKSSEKIAHPSTGWRKIRSRLPAYLTIGTLVFFGLGPIYWMIVTSLRPQSEVYDFPPSLLPTSLSLEHFEAFANNSQLLRNLANSVGVATVTAIGSVIVGSYAAFSFSKFRYRGRKTAMYLIVSSQIFPQALLLIAMFLMFRTLGLLNTYIGLVLSFTTFTLPLSVWMLKGYFDAMPDELVEAARVDGAGILAIVHRVILPVARPALIATGLFAFIRAWNDFIFAVTLVGSEKQTLPPGLTNAFLGEFNAAWADLMAASIVVSTPVVIAFFFLQRHMTEGLSGAVKG